MPKDTKTLGNNKARACESLGFVHKKRLCQRFDTTSFKGFKGKFIYIGGACIISALLLCAIVSTLASFMWGGITLVIVMFGGLGITSQLQRKGLHRKDKRKGIYIVSRTFIRDRKK